MFCSPPKSSIQSRRHFASSLLTLNLPSNALLPSTESAFFIVVSPCFNPRRSPWSGAGGGSLPGELPFSFILPRSMRSLRGDILETYAKKSRSSAYLTQQHDSQPCIAHQFCVSSLPLKISCGRLLKSANRELKRRKNPARRHFGDIDVRESKAGRASL